MSDRLKMLGGDAPVAPEDRAPGFLRGAGARSPLFWKLMLVVMALMWGYSFFIMKDTLDSIPTFMLLACRFLISASVLFVLFMKRIRVHFNRRNIVVGSAMCVHLRLSCAFQTFGLA